MKNNVNPKSLFKNCFIPLFAFICGVVVTLIVTSVFFSATKVNGSTLVSSYEGFGFHEFKEEELQSQEAYISRLYMEAEKRCLEVKLDNDILYDQAIIDYLTDILSKIPKGSFQYDVSQIESVISAHQETLANTIENQKSTRNLMNRMNEFTEKYLK